jgi:hypothetical protein
MTMMMMKKKMMWTASVKLSFILLTGSSHFPTYQFFLIDFWAVNTRPTNSFIIGYSFATNAPDHGASWEASSRSAVQETSTPYVSQTLITVLIKHRHWKRSSTSVYSNI